MQNSQSAHNQAQPTSTPQPTEVSSLTQTPSSQRKLLKWLTAGLIILLFTTTSIFAYKYYQLKQQLNKTQPSPANKITTTSPSPITDPTANWKIYINSEYGYSIKYPQTFKTQVLAAGAGEKEASPDVRNLFIYNPETKDPYLNRYINLEFLQLEPTYSSEWTKTEVIIGNKSATKLINSNQASDFDIYLVRLENNKGLLEIYVSNSKDKTSTANQILSTFQFTN